MALRRHIFVTYLEGDGPFVKIVGQLDRHTVIKIDRLLSSCRRKVEENRVDASVIKVGQKFVVRNRLDDTFYRGQISSTANIVNGEVEVYFIDYGHMEHVSCNDIYSYDILLRNVMVPPQAEVFILSGLYKPKGSWDIEFISNLQDSLIDNSYPFRIDREVQSIRIINMDCGLSHLVNKAVKNKECQIIPIGVQELVVHDILRSVTHSESTTQCKIIPDDFQEGAAAKIMDGRSHFPNTMPTPPMLGSVPNPLNVPYPGLFYNGVPMNQFSNTSAQVPPHPSVTSRAMPSGRHLPMIVPVPHAEPLRRTPPQTAATFTIPLLPVTSVHDVYVCAIDNGPAVFAVHLLNKTHELEFLMSQINSVRNHISNNNPQVGTMCLGPSSGDDRLHRTLVIEKHGAVCKLLYIDYGNSEMLNNKDIYQIPHQFSSIQAYALSFSLNGFQNVTITEKIKSIFFELVSDQKLQLEVVSPVGPDVLQYCNLYLNATSIKNLICEELMKSHEDVQQLVQIPGYEYLMVFTLMPKANLGTSHNVIVSYVETTARFYVHMSSHSDSLSEVMNALQEHCYSAPPVHFEDIRPGMVCAALFSDDNTWYRAKIKKIYEKKIDIEYVDYGNCDQVDLVSIKQINPHLVVCLEAQAIPCALAGYENNTDESAANLFEMLTNDKTVELITRDYSQDGEVMIVDLLDTNTTPSLNLGHRLFELLQPKQKVKASNVGSRLDIVFPSQHSYQDVAQTDAQSTYSYKNEVQYSQPQKNSTSCLDPDEDKIDNTLQTVSAAYQNKISENNYQSDIPEAAPTAYTNRNESRTLNTNKRPTQSYYNENKSYVKEINTTKNISHENSTSKNISQENSTKSYSSNKGSSGYNKRSNNSEVDSNSAQDKSFAPKPKAQQQPAQQQPAPVYAPLITPFPELDIALDTNEDAAIACFKTPGSFSIQLLSKEKGFLKMMTEIQSAYKTRTAEPLELSSGNSVIAKYYSDNNFYRGEILHKDKQAYVVDFVDYGNQSTVNIDDIFMVEKRFMELPRNAVLCKLDGVIKNKNNTIDPKKVKELFQQDRYNCEFLSLSDLGVYGVNLKYKNTTVAEQLIQCGFALRPFDEKPASPQEVEEAVDLPLLTGQCIRMKLVSVSSYEYFCLQLTSGGTTIRCRLHGDVTKQVCTVAAFKTDAVGLEFLVYVHEIVHELMSVSIYTLSGTLMKLIDDVNAGPIAIPSIPPMPVLNSEAMVLVPHVESLHEIYIQKLNQLPLIEYLLGQLFEFYEANGKGADFVLPLQHDYCAAKALDTNWYRGEILSIDKTQVIIKYIDYGNCETLPRENIKQLDEAFKAKPELALKVGINAVAVCENNLLVEKLNELILNIDSKICLSSHNEYGWVTDFTTETTPSVFDALLQLNMITDKRSVIDLNEDGDSVVVEEDNLVASGSAANIVEDESSVIISHIDSPGQFYVQYKHDLDVLDALHETLQNSIESLRTIERPEVGLLCTARYTADEMWYRAVVLDMDDDITTVRFMDFGNTDVLNNSDKLIKSSLEEYDSTQCLAHCCSLMLTPANHDEWSPEACELLEELKAEDTLTIEVLKEVDNTLFVNLYNNDTNISDEFIKRNYGQCIPASNTNVDNLSVGKSKQTQKPSFDLLLIQDIHIPDDNYEGADGYVSHINSISEFYVQLERDTAMLEWMENELLTADTFPDVKDIEEYKLCVAKFPDDGLYYRAEILNIVNEGIEVCFVDYGNSAVVKEYKPVPSSCHQVPILARKFSLKLPENIEKWPEESEAKFRELCADGVTVVKIEKVHSPDIVHLYIDGVNVLDHLVPLCSTPILSSDPALSQDTVSECIELTERLTPLGEPNVANSCVSHFITLKKFWMQKESSITELEEMAESLESADTFLPIEKELVSGTLCAAFYPEDELWYRAEILSKFDNKIDVLYIDYGNCCIIEPDVRALPPNIATIPWLAQQYELQLPNGYKKWSQEAENKFKELAADGQTTFQVEIVQNLGEVCLIKLFLNGKNIADELTMYLEPLDKQCETVTEISVTSNISSENVSNVDVAVPEKHTESNVSYEKPEDTSSNPEQVAINTSCENVHSTEPDSYDTVSNVDYNDIDNVTGNNAVNSETDAHENVSLVDNESTDPSCEKTCEFESNGEHVNIEYTQEAVSADDNNCIITDASKTHSENVSNDVVPETHTESNMTYEIPQDVTSNPEQGEILTSYDNVYNTEADSYDTASNVDYNDTDNNEKKNFTGKNAVTCDTDEHDDVHDVSLVDHKSTDPSCEQASAFESNGEHAEIEYTPEAVSANDNDIQSLSFEITDASKTYDSYEQTNATVPDPSASYEKTQVAVSNSEHVDCVTVSESTDDLSDHDQTNSNNADVTSMLEHAATTAMSEQNVVSTTEHDDTTTEYADTTAEYGDTTTDYTDCVSNFGDLTVSNDDVLKMDLVDASLGKVEHFVASTEHIDICNSGACHEKTITGCDALHLQLVESNDITNVSENLNANPCADTIAEIQSTNDATLNDNDSDSCSKNCVENSKDMPHSQMMDKSNVLIEKITEDQIYTKSSTDLVKYDSDTETALIHTESIVGDKDTDQISESHKNASVNSEELHTSPNKNGLSLQADAEPALESAPLVKLVSAQFPTQFPTINFSLASSDDEDVKT